MGKYKIYHPLPFSPNNTRRTTRHKDRLAYLIYEFQGMLPIEWIVSLHEYRGTLLRSPTLRTSLVMAQASQDRFLLHRNRFAAPAALLLDLGIIQILNQDNKTLRERGLLLIYKTVPTWAKHTNMDALSAGLALNKPTLPPGLARLVHLLAVCTCLL